MDRRALEGNADDTPVLERGGEAARVEPVDPAPESRVRVQRLLRLEADEVLDRVERIARLAVQEKLAGEESAVEFFGTEHSGPHRGGRRVRAHRENGAIVALPLAYLRCPHCGGALADAAGAIRCAAGHSFDVAPPGYLGFFWGGRGGGGG